MRIPRIPPFVQDIALAAVLTFMGIVTALPYPAVPEGTAALDVVIHWTPVALLMVSTLSLALRRLLPLTVMIVTATALTASQVADDSAAGWLAFFIGAFSAGLHDTGRRRTAIAFAILGLIIPALWLTGWGGVASDDPFFPVRYLLVIGVWWTGDVLRSRERQVLALVAAGATNREIGQAMGRSEIAIKKRLQVVFAKLGVVDRAHAVAESIRRGLI